MPRKLTDEDLSRLAVWIGEGRSCREIAPRLGVSPATAIRWARRSGLTSARAHRIDAEARASLRRALAEGTAPAAAAARFGVSLRTALRHRDPEAAAARRAALVAEVHAGARLADAAASAGVSPSTAARWTRGLERARGRRARIRDEALALAAMEAGMAPAEAAETYALDDGALKRLASAARLAPARLARRERLFAAIASGLSCRKAAALAGMPVATAIRWARAGGGAAEIRERRAQKA